MDENPPLDNTDSVITACVDPGKWIIKISKAGFIFNHEDYPHANPDSFAKAFVEILEKQYIVTMDRRASDGNRLFM